MTDIFPGATVITTTGFSARTKPDPNLAFSVIHTTAGLASAETHAHLQPIGSGQVTATFWTNRNGSAVQSLTDPLRQAPWTNGVVLNPDMTSPRIAACVQAGVNPNRRSLITIENVSLEPDSPITDAQVATCARIVAWAHALAGVPVNRQTVVGHYQIHSGKVGCPSINRDSRRVVDRIVAMAQGGTADDSMTIVTYTPFPEGQRTWSANTSKIYTGYKPDGSVKNATLNAGSNAPASGTAHISQNPQKAPNGSGFVLISAGVFAGYYMLGTDGTVAAPPPVPPADCSAQEARIAELEAQVAAARVPAEQTVEALS